MNRQEVLQHIKSTGIVPVIRTNAKDDALKIAEAIIEGGINCLEITMTVSGAIELIAELSERFQNSVLIGAGTVLDEETARNCIAAGAKFVVTPCLIVDVIKTCNQQGILICAGALTPTEVFTAWKAGADVVKVFPASATGGANYLKALKAPFQQIELMPTGGVTLDTAKDFIRAGACAIGVGSDLADVKAVRTGETKKIKHLAQLYLETVNETRAAIELSSEK